MGKEGHKCIWAKLLIWPVHVRSMQEARCSLTGVGAGEACRTVTSPLTVLWWQHVDVLHCWTLAFEYNNIYKLRCAVVQAQSCKATYLMPTRGSPRHHQRLARVLTSHQSLARGATMGVLGGRGAGDGGNVIKDYVSGSRVGRIRTLFLLHLWDKSLERTHAHKCRIHPVSYGDGAPAAANGRNFPPPPPPAGSGRG